MGHELLLEYRECYRNLNVIKIEAGEGSEALIKSFAR